jgi:hypothetical protein
VDMVQYFIDNGYGDLKALFDACESKKEIAALKKRIEGQLDGGRWIDGTFQEPVCEVKACYGAVDAFAKDARNRFKVEAVRMVSAKESRVQMADRYLSRSNRVGRLR